VKKAVPWTGISRQWLRRTNGPGKQAFTFEFSLPSSMDLAQFGTELKARRVAQQISLTDISSETRINIRFLEAIERGDFHILPQTYVRAFLREYALIVGIAPDEMMHTYDEILSGPRPAPSAKTEEAAMTLPASSGFTDQQKRVLLVGGPILAILIVALLFMLGPLDPSLQPAVEQSFDRVVNENEAATKRMQPLPQPATAAPAAVDSLRLEITTSDSVWVSLTVDNLASQEYLFGQNRTRSWTAKDRFLVTMGNAGGATFRLNGVDLGALGRRGAVIRNIPITSTTVKSPAVPERRSP
jgi:transcriptional regulator with XRE-family HTH domain